jgi:hypothetical protein
MEELLGLLLTDELGNDFVQAGCPHDGSGWKPDLLSLNGFGISSSHDRQRGCLTNKAAARLPESKVLRTAGNVASFVRVQLAAARFGETRLRWSRRNGSRWHGFLVLCEHGIERDIGLRFPRDRRPFARMVLPLSFAMQQSA